MLYLYNKLTHYLSSQVLAAGFYKVSHYYLTSSLFVILERALGHFVIYTELYIQL